MGNIALDHIIENGYYALMKMPWADLMLAMGQVANVEIAKI